MAMEWSNALCLDGPLGVSVVPYYCSKRRRPPKCASVGVQYTFVQ